LGLAGKKRGLSKTVSGNRSSHYGSGAVSLWPFGTYLAPEDKPIKIHRLPWFDKNTASFDFDPTDDIDAANGGKISLGERARVAQSLGNFPHWDGFDFV
jgi:hypothetical protein